MSHSRLLLDFFVFTLLFVVNNRYNRNYNSNVFALQVIRTPPSHRKSNIGRTTTTKRLGGPLTNHHYTTNHEKEATTTEVRTNILSLFSTANDESSITATNNIVINNKSSKFDMSTALFCGGLAFDAYVEPPKESSRWERGAKGMNVAFVSYAFTRSLYNGIIEVTPIQITDLPDEDDTAEGLMTGGGTDAYLLVAAVENNKYSYKEDLSLIQRQQYHDGVLSLKGSAHVGRSSTAWANVNDNKAINTKKKTGKGMAYHVPSSWGKGGQAIFMDEQPFYMYVQDPRTVQLVYTVMDEDLVGADTPIGSAYRKLSDLIPGAKLSTSELIQQLKDSVIQQIKDGNVDNVDIDESLFKINFDPKNMEWTGKIKLTSKPVKKDKGGQVTMGVVAGAAIAGPVGAAVGGALMNMYEGQIRGCIELKIRYLPIPDIGGKSIKRDTYEVKGGLPGVDWGVLYEKHLLKQNQHQQQHLTLEQEEVTTPSSPLSLSDMNLAGSDLEHCFFVTHDDTGCSGSVYRSLEKKLIVVSFRGTCEPKDILTDANIIQQAWVEGEELDEKDGRDTKTGLPIAKVHVGFRNSLNSISRRLKELILASIEEGDDMSQYDMLITGHSLGGSLATLFIADIGEYGIDAGRALPQVEPSEAWFSSLAKSFMADKIPNISQPPPPPRPKTLKMYTFGAPRVGNGAFVKRFTALQEQGKIDEAYRIVNGDDVIARNPRTINAIIGGIEYDHCGSTVLLNDDNDNNDDPVCWVEGETDDKSCPVRDGVATNSPLADGALIGDLLSATRDTLLSSSTTSTTTAGNISEGTETDNNDSSSFLNKLGTLANKVTDRVSTLDAKDIASVVGINKDFTEREMRMISKVVSGEALAHHMEDEYYSSMGRAAGFIAKVNEDIKEAS